MRRRAALLVARSWNEVLSQTVVSQSKGIVDVDVDVDVDIVVVVVVVVHNGASERVAGGVASGVGGQR